MSSTPKISVVIPEETAAFIRRESETSLPNETGGIVLGTTCGSSFIVTHAVEPGPHAHHRPSRFVRDGTFAQEAMNALVQETGGRVKYLGEWHSHPKPAGPSARDRDSLRWISRNPSYACTEPILILCRWSRQQIWQIEGYVWRGNGLSGLDMQSASIETSK